MPVFDQGGGGGLVGSVTENTDHTLSKPYELSVWGPEILDQINQMFDLIFQSLTKHTTEIRSIPTTTDAGPFVVDFTLSNTQIGAINSSPVTVVAAPGANYVVIPIFFGCRITKATGAWNTSASIKLRLKDIAVDISQVLPMELTTAGTVEKTKAGVTNNTPIDFGAGVDARNTALVVIGSADPSQGAGGNATIYGTVAYYLVKAS